MDAQTGRKSLCAVAVDCDSGSDSRDCFADEAGSGMSDHSPNKDQDFRVAALQEAQLSDERSIVIHQPLPPDIIDIESSSLMFVWKPSSVTGEQNSQLSSHFHLVHQVEYQQVRTDRCHPCSTLTVMSHALFMLLIVLRFPSSQDRNFFDFDRIVVCYSWSSRLEA